MEKKQMSNTSVWLLVLVCTCIAFSSEQTLGQSFDNTSKERVVQDSITPPISQGSNTNSGFKVWLQQRTKAAQNYYFGAKVPYAGRSALLSTVFPGAGQIYNKQSWKIGLVWGGIGFTLYNLDQNISQYRRFREAYELSVMGEEHALSFLSQNALKSYRDQFRSNLELNYIALGAVYLLNIAEAFISGHLAGFDVSEDLSFYVPPGTPGTPIQLGWVYQF